MVLDQLLLRGDGVEIRHRMRILRPASSVRVTPVIHVQSERDKAVTLDASQADTIYDAVIAASHPGKRDGAVMDRTFLLHSQALGLSAARCLFGHDLRKSAPGRG